MIERYFLLAAAAGTAIFSLCGGQQSIMPGFGGRITAVIGNAEIFQAKKGGWRKATAGAAVEFGDSIRTATESKVDIRFGANTISVDELTLVAVDSSVDSTGRLSVELFNHSGGVLAHIGKLIGGHRSFSVRTPTALASIRGTHFYVHFDAAIGLSHVDVFHGKVWVVNPLLPPVPPVIVMPGFYTEVRPLVVPIVPVAIPYGHWKKLARIMPRPIYLRYHKKLQFHRFGPPPPAPAVLFQRGSAKAWSPPKLHGSGAMAPPSPHRILPHGSGAKKSVSPASVHGLTPRPAQKPHLSGAAKPTFQHAESPALHPSRRKSLTSVSSHPKRQPKGATEEKSKKRKAK